jgi:hypothetical protein
MQEDAMRLTQLHIQNFKSCKDLTLQIGAIHALVGANNAGKSSVLRALDFLFNPSTKTLSEESFWNMDLSREIRVEAIFESLTDAEKASLAPYLHPDGRFQMARYARMGAKATETEATSEQADDKISIGQQCMKPLPDVPWLQEDCITAKSIGEWWKTKDQLVVAGISFAEAFKGATKAPGVREWTEKAKEFVAANMGILPLKDTWIDNPKGYPNVLKRTLPFFVLVPAVRDVTEEAKGTKSSPFGKLLYAILDAVTQEKKAKIEGMLAEVSKQMNRTGGDERVPLISETERQLNNLLGDLFIGCDLEIEFSTPTLEVLLSAPKLYVDDGFRNAVENKGHGLQRAVIFTILRRYAEHMTSTSDGRKRNLILGVEEPELYMHPQAQRTIRRAFRKIAESGDQVLFSTHSSLLVDVSFFDEIIRLESSLEDVGDKKASVSTAWQLPIQSVILDLETRCPKLQGNVTEDSVRDLYSHAYNPRRNEGFFASKIILVEGLTEEYSLPVYADALPGCALDPKGISVVECGGKGQMDRLYRVFNELHIPCFLLFDYDKGNTDKNVIAKSKELLELLGVPSDEPSNLLVDDSVACFPSKWETHLQSEIPGFAELTAEARAHLGLSGDTGKPLIARYIARKITTASPAHVPPSLAKIIEKAAAVTWKKSCLIGSDKVESPK